MIGPAIKAYVREQGLKLIRAIERRSKELPDSYCAYVIDQIDMLTEGEYIEMKAEKEAERKKGSRPIRPAGLSLVK